MLIIFDDDGVGIDENIISKIFNYGFTTTSGSGLGLTHVKEIVEEKMRGKIWLESEKGKGTKFLIQIQNKND